MRSKESENDYQDFTQRERSILNLIAEGYKDKEIADELHMSEKTLREYQVNLMTKLKAPNISSVIDYALEKGAITIYEVLESRFRKRKLVVN